MSRSTISTFQLFEMFPVLQRRAHRAPAGGRRAGPGRPPGCAREAGGREGRRGGRRGQPGRPGDGGSRVQAHPEGAAAEGLINGGAGTAYSSGADLLNPQQLPDQVGSADHSHSSVGTLSFRRTSRALGQVEGCVSRQPASPKLQLPSAFESQKISGFPGIRGPPQAVIYGGFFGTLEEWR